MEHRRVCSIVITAIHRTGGYDLDGCLGADSVHSACLHRRCLRTQQTAGINIERVLHITRRVIGRQVQTLEIVIIQLHLRALLDGVAHTEKNLLDLIDHQCQRMSGAQLGRLARQGNIQSLGSQTQSLSPGGQLAAFALQRTVQRNTQLVYQLAHSGTLLRRQLAHGFGKLGNQAFFAQVFELQLGKLLVRYSIRQLALHHFLNFFDFIKHNSYLCYMYRLQKSIFIPLQDKNACVSGQLIPIRAFKSTQNAVFNPQRSSCDNIHMPKQSLCSQTNARKHRQLAPAASP